jgi:hypothetical protein
LTLNPDHFGAGSTKPAGGEKTVKHAPARGLTVRGFVTEWLPKRRERGLDWKADEGRLNLGDGARGPRSSLQAELAVTASSTRSPKIGSRVVGNGSRWTMGNG